jgi:hypothetical protein
VSNLEACFEKFRSTAFRLETLPDYAMPAEDARIAAFRAGVPMPERSVRTSPWLRRMAATTAAGKSWQRVRVLEHPLNEYSRFELATYVESAAAGERIRITDRAAHPDLGALTRDFWLFDADTDHPFTALMFYDDEGGYTGAEITGAREVIRRCQAHQQLALRHSVELSAYLASRQIEAA